MKYVPLNFDLMLNPFNWFVIVLMVAIAAFGVATIFPNVVNKD